MDDVAKGEIIYGDITITYKQKNIKKKKTLINEVFARKYEGGSPKIPNDLYSSIIRKIDKKNNPDISDMVVVDIKVKARTGYISTATGYTKVSKSDEKRNKITGAYE